MVTQQTTANMRISSDASCGGKITELFHYRLGRNLLVSAFDQAEICVDERNFAVSGWDEVFPTLEPHGEIPALGYAWRMRAKSCLVTDGLHTCWHMEHWALQRTIRVQYDDLTAEYALTNLQDIAMPALWAAHVLFPLDGLHIVELPSGTPLPGPHCDMGSLASLFSIGNTLCGNNMPLQARSWKFFLSARAPVILRYHDVHLRLRTDAPWWGIWLNLGMHATRCLGIEPTNAPTDNLADVREYIPGNGGMHFSLRMSVLPIDYEGS